MKRIIITSLFVAISVYANAQVGIGTLAPKAGLHVADSSVVFAAPGDVAEAKPVPIAGEGRRMMWYVDKAAFRAGYVGSFSSTYWDASNIGNYSFGAGQHVRASGESSFAVGRATTASGDASVALGDNGTASADRALSSTELPARWALSHWVAARRLRVTTPWLWGRHRSPPDLLRLSSGRPSPEVHSGSQSVCKIAPAEIFPWRWVKTRGKKSGICRDQRCKRRVQQR
jgi:hypothetical protein